MRVLVNLILKTIKNNIILIVSKDESTLLNFELDTKHSIEYQINSYLKNFELESQWIELKLFQTEINNGVLMLYYSGWIPEQFIGKTMKFLDVKSISDISIATNIANSLRFKG